MLAPEVEKFNPPKIITGLEKYPNTHLQEKNNVDTLYKSLVLAIPDEHQIPISIQDVILEDIDYYKISNCSLIEFFDPVFIEYFIKKGKLYCLTANRNCVVDNCAEITPNGILSIHLLKCVYECLGVQGKQRNYGFYEVNIDLKCLKQEIVDKIEQSPVRDELFDFYLVWESDSDDVCPSSIAKYFSDKNVNIIASTPDVKHMNPFVNKVPGLDDIDAVVEWIGMLCHNIKMEQKHAYISSYEEPDTTDPIDTNKISLLIIKGFFTPTTIIKTCTSILEYVLARDLSNYWACFSYQNSDNSLWQINSSSQRQFQALDCCNSIFFTQKDVIKHKIGQLKYT